MVACSTISEPYYIIATACFSGDEDLRSVNPEVSANTYIDFNKSHQQFTINLYTRKLKVYYPAAELKVNVTQNGRSDNEVSVVNPSRFTPDLIVYDNNRSLIFEAGNV